MRRLALVLLLALALPGSSHAAHPRCQFGRAQGFISVRNNPEFLVGTVPNRFSSSSRYFSRRYNCKGNLPLIRRVDLGLYDVRFPGLARRTAFATAISQEGVSVSVQPMGDVYRVALRGPLAVNEVLSRRDVAFSIVLF